MWRDAARIAGTIASIPAGAAVRAVQGAIGGAVVLLADIRRGDDARDRAAFLHRLRRAAADPDVKGVLLTLEGPPGGWASCSDLRRVIADLRAAGKPVYAALEQPGNAAMWIASACDRVFIVPTGEVLLIGIGTELQFFGDLLDRLGVEADFEAAGRYKSFGEPFLRRFASPDNQEAMRALIGDLQDQLVEGIAAGRRLTEDAVRDLLVRAPLSAKDAVDAGLCDQLAYRDEILKWIDGQLGGKSKPLEIAKWARRDVVAEWADRLGEARETVAVVYLEGNIVMDDHGPGTRIRAKRAVKILDKLREDDDVKAVVLHVNSPGGSALASDIIWHEVDRLQRTRPVVACFEDVSASGGFYLAAPAAEILARPTSLTGSIGVFGGKLVLSDAMRKSGVHTQQILGAPNAALFSPSHRFTDDQRVRFRGSLQRFYDGFVGRVAAGRRTPVDVIEPHCRGRVWTGRAARERGLVDRFGDRFDAIERARELAGLHAGDFALREVDVQPNRGVIARVVHNAWRSVAPFDARAQRVDRVLAALDGWWSPSLEFLLAHPDEPLALLPYTLTTG